MTRVRTSLLLALGALGAVGCSAQGNNAMIILNIAVPNGEDCTYDPSAETFSDSGAFDMETQASYQVVARVKGTLEEDPNATTRHHVQIQGANVRLLPAPTERSRQLIADLGDRAERTVLTSGTLEPGDGSQVTIGVTMIDSEQSAALLASGAFEPGVQIVASFTMFGSVDGNDVESYSFNYPVTLCTDCILDFEDCLPDDSGEPITDMDMCMTPVDDPPRSRTSGCAGDQIP